MAKPALVIDHWHAWYQGVNFSPREFYDDLEEALKRRQIPEAAISRTTWSESGLASAGREYLRIKRGRLTFDICAAPFGTDFFFSWWLANLPSWLLGLLYTAGIGLLFLLTLRGASFSVWSGCSGILGLPLFFGALLLAFGVAVRLRVLGDEEAVLAMPFLGRLYERIFQPLTYFAVDSQTMFQSVVHAAVLEVVDQWTSAKGLRALSEAERRSQGESKSTRQAA